MVPRSRGNVMVYCLEHWKGRKMPGHGWFWCSIRIALERRIFDGKPGGFPGEATSPTPFLVFRRALRGIKLLFFFWTLHQNWSWLTGLLAWRTTQYRSNSTRSHFTAVDHRRDCVLAVLHYRVVGPAPYCPILLRIAIMLYPAVASSPTYLRSRAHHTPNAEFSSKDLLLSGNQPIFRRTIKVPTAGHYQSTYCRRLSKYPLTVGHRRDWLFALRLYL